MAGTPASPAAAPAATSTSPPKKKSPLQAPPGAGSPSTQSPAKGSAPGTPQGHKVDIPPSLLVALHKRTVESEVPRPSSAGPARTQPKAGEGSGTPEVAHRAGPRAGAAVAVGAAAAATAAAAAAAGAGSKAEAADAAGAAGAEGGAVQALDSEGAGASPSGAKAQENVGNGHAHDGTANGGAEADAKEGGALGTPLLGGEKGEGEGKGEGGLSPGLAASLRLQEETGGVPVFTLGGMAAKDPADIEAGRLLHEEWKQKRAREWRRRAFIWVPLVLLVVVGAVVGALLATGVFKPKQEYSLVPAPPASVTASILGGVCDSSNPPLLPDGAPTMPSFWWSSSVKNGSRVSDTNSNPLDF